MIKALKDYITWNAFVKAVEQVKHIDPKKDIGKYLSAVRVAQLVADRLLTGKKRERAQEVLAALSLVGTAAKTPAFNSED